MSSIRFHFDDGDIIDVSGSERAHFAILAENFTQGIARPNAFGETYDMLHPFINPSGTLANQAARTPAWGQALMRQLSTIGFRTGPAPFAWKGLEIDVLYLIINTVIAAGSDALRMAMRIHWTCESYGYVMGYHRKWMADVIEEGLEEGIYRKGFRRANDKHAMDEILGRGVPEDAIIFQSMGWTELIKKLREDRSGPVVMSFSGGDSFPNDMVGDWMPEWPKDIPADFRLLPPQEQERRRQRVDEWEELSFERQWAISVKGLKAKGRNRPMGPGNLRTRFGHGLSLINLMNHDIERIEKGLKIT